MTQCKINYPDKITEASGWQQLGNITGFRESKEIATAGRTHSALRFNK